MKHIFLDTNMLIDLLMDRKPFSEYTEKLFEMASDKLITLYAASVSFNNMYYIVRQQYTHARTITLLSDLASFVEILAVDSAVINKALASGFKDFEDAIQNFCAEANPAVEAIATRNGKDFKKSNLPVFGPEAVLRLV